MKYCMVHSTSRLEIDGRSILKQLVECSIRYSMCNTDPLTLNSNVAVSSATKFPLCIDLTKYGVYKENALAIKTEA